MAELPQDTESVVNQIIAAFSPQVSPFDYSNNKDAEVWKARLAFLDACFFDKSTYDSFFSGVSQTEYLEKFTPWYFVLLEVDPSFISYILPRLMCACLRSPERWVVDVSDVLSTLDYDSRYKTLKEGLGDEYEEYAQHYPSSILTFLTSLTKAQAQAVKDWLILARDLFPEDRDEIEALLRQKYL